MGLFSGKDKTYVFSQTQPLIVDTNFTNADAVMYAVLKNQSISKTLVDTASKGMSLRVPAMLRYAKDRYALGLPTNSHSTTNKLCASEVADIITEDLELPYGCLVSFHYIAPLTLPSIVLPFLLSTRGYSLTTNQISTIPDGWVFPEKYYRNVVHVRVVVDNISLDGDDTVALINYKATAYYSRYHSGGRDADDYWAEVEIPADQYTQDYQESYEIPNGFNLGRDYCVAGYHVLDADAKLNDVMDWWYYAIDAGAYPALNPVIISEETNNSFPVVPVRYNNEFISTDNHPEIYTTGKALLKKVGASLDGIQTTLDSNPDIAEIDHAYVMFGVDLQTDDSLLLGYLVNFFTYLSEAGNTTVWNILDGIIDSGRVTKSSNYIFGSTPPSTTPVSSSYVHDVFGSTGITNTNIINPNDFLSLVEHGLNITLSYDSIHAYTRQGTIGEVGTATKEIIVEEFEHAYDGEHYRTASLGPQKMYLRKQLSVDAYQEVVIVNLVHKNQIHGNYSVLTTPTGVLEDEDEHNLIIPLHYGLVQKISKEDQQAFYAGTMVLVITGVYKIHVKWYETGLFKIIIMAVGFIIAAYTGQAWVAGMAAAATAGTAALLVFLLESVLVSVAMNLVMDGLVDILGEDFALLLSMVAAAVAVAYGDISAIEVLSTTLVTAENLLMASVSLITASGRAVSEKTQEITEDSAEFSEYAEEQWTWLKKQIQLLEPENPLAFNYLDAPFTSVTPEIASKPDDLYNRIHIGNVGTLSLDVIEHYANMTLLLPEGIE